MKTVKEMKEAILKMNEFFERSDRLFLEDEAASDRAYKEGCKLEVELVDTIVKVSRGLIDRKTARRMVISKEFQPRLLGICEKFCS